MPDRLGHYEILDKLGEGGMGQVFRARDTKLGREVALKLLPPQLLRDPERIARLEREARLLAALNHPHVAALYGMEEDGEQRFLVMELVEGTDLAARISQGPLPVDAAVELGLQVAGGLEAAHEKGIVHRDLKPANVMVTPQGTAKLLDFGLARAAAEEGGGDPSASPTITAAMTQAGMILGTAAYMSPEQARGKVADRQSDIWSFGVLLYEMLTAHGVFAGETISDSIGAILHKEPEWERLPPATPPQLRQLLRRCLERDPRRRLRDIGDARVALEEARQDPTGSSFGMVDPSVLGQARPRGGYRLAVAVGLLALLGGLVAGRSLAPSSPPEPVRKLALGVDHRPGTFREGSVLAMSPDGQRLAYRHDDALMLRQLGARDPRPVPGSERAQAPFWSPDGSELAWFAGTTLFRAPVTGGQPVPVCELPQRPVGGVGGSWSEDDRIVFALGSGPVYEVNARGGRPAPIIGLPAGINDFHEPVHLPGGRGLLVVAHPDSTRPNSLQLHRDGQFTELWQVGEDETLWAPGYSPSGHIVVAVAQINSRDAALWAVPFDVDRGELSGEAFLVEARAHWPSVAADGTLAYLANPQADAQWSVRRIGYDGSDQGTLFTGGRGQLEIGGVSPDGTRMVYITEPADGGSPELFVRDIGGGSEIRLTRDDFSDANPMWHPDGESIVYIRLDFSSQRATAQRVPADGSAPPQQLAQGAATTIEPGSGELLLVRTRGEDHMSLSRMDSLSVWSLPLEGGEARLLAEAEQTIFPMDVDPSGRFALLATGIRSVNSLSLSRLPGLRARWAVSTSEDIGGGSFHPEGTHLYFLEDKQLVALELELGERPRFGRRSTLARLPDNSESSLKATPDGLLVVVPSELDSEGNADASHAQIEFTLHWAQAYGAR